MPRGNSYSHPRLSTYRYRQNWDGYQSGSSTLTTGEDTGTLQRPDVIKVKAVDGFRKPTAWYVKDVGRSDWQGNYEADLVYSNKPGDSRSHWVEGSMFYVPDGLYDIPYTATLPPVNDVNRALANALNNVRDQAVNLSVMFAESVKTVELVAERALTLFQAFSAMKKRDWQAASKALKVKSVPNSRDTASAHLELQYGWIPLVADMAGAYESTRQQYQREGFIIGAKSTIRDVREEHGRLPFVSGVATRWESTTVTASKVSLWFKVESEALRQASRVGIGDIAAVAWEMTPWSFVADWVIPIGNWLSALQAHMGLTFLGGTNTRMVRMVSMGLGWPVSHPHRIGGFRWVGKLADIGSTARYFEMDRQVYTSAPIPVPYYKSPFSTSHALNSVALLRTLK